MSEQPIVPDPLSSDPDLMSLYLGVHPTTGERLWADDPRIALARAEVTSWYEATYSNEDTLAAKHEASLNQTAARVYDQWSQSDPEGFKNTVGVYKQNLDDYARSTTPTNQAHHAAAVELVKITDHPAYLDKYHERHAAYVQRATELFQALYDSQPNPERSV